MPFVKKNPDRSKRVAPGCKIDVNNIITGRTRTRKDFNYKESSLKERDLDDVRESKNLYEKRTEVNKDITKIIEMEKRKGKENKKKTTKKKDTKKETKKESKKKEPKKIEELEEEEEEAIQKENKVTKKKDTKKKKEEKEKKKEEKKETKKEKEDKKDSKKKKEEKKEDTKKHINNDEKKGDPKSDYISEKLLKEIKRLGGKEMAKESRTYGERIIPKPIQAFCDAFTNIELCHDEMDYIFEATGEFLLKEDDAVKFKFIKEHSDYILIGDGEYILAALMDSVKDGDFDVYLITEDKEAQGPFKMSEFLAGCVVYT